MSALAIALIVFTCVFGSAVLGMFLSGVLPDHHVKDDSKDVMKLMVALLATMSALVLGLLISSAKSSFDKVNDELVRVTADIVALDRTMAQYGPETAEIRSLLKQTYLRAYELLFSEDEAQKAKLETPATLARAEAVQVKVNNLEPGNDAQRRLQARAVAIAGELSLARWLLAAEREGSRLLPVVVVLVFWLCVIFTVFGLFAPRNGTVVCVFVVSALSVAGAIFLILEMERPLDGVVRISGASLLSTLSHLGE